MLKSGGIVMEISYPHVCMLNLLICQNFRCAQKDIHSKGVDFMAPLNFYDEYQ